MAAEAGDLPAIYSTQVTGDDEDTLRQSLTGARETFEADRKHMLAEALPELARATPEGLLETYGEVAKPLAERLASGPVSIGAPGGPGRQPTPSRRAGKLTAGSSLSDYRTVMTERTSKR
jgi:hypothetical protein